MHTSYQGTGLKMKQPQHRLAPTRDAGVAESGLIHTTPMLAPTKFLKYLNSLTTLPSGSYHDPQPVHEKSKKSK